MAYDFEDLINMFLEEKDIAPISKRQYKSNMLRFYKWVKDEGREIYELRNADAVRYKELLKSKAYTSLTIAGYMTTIKLFFQWLAKNDLGKDITTSIRINKSYNTFKKKSLTVDECKRFLQQFDTETLSGKRAYAIANLMLRNGLREIEVVRMDVKDITEHDGKMAIMLQRKGKYQKDACIPLSEKAMVAIESYLVDRTDNFKEASPLFVSMSNNSRNKRITTAFISQMIKGKLEAAGLKGRMYTAHSLRHTTATLLIAEGKSEYEVKTFMGHSNFATTQIYTRQKEMQMIFNKMPTKLIDNCF